jgi:hypothetical protein
MMEARVLENDKLAATDHDAEVQRLKRMVEAGDVNGARAYVKQLQERWPESARVKYWASVLAPAVARRTGRSTGRRLDEEHAWLRAHAHEHRGHWVAVWGSHLVAASADLAEVLKEVEAHPEWERPLLHRFRA